MADESVTVFYGTWKITECLSLAGRVEPTGIEGTLFQLEENGDVSWKVSDNAEPMPLFHCESYQVSSGESASLKFLGSFAGQPIEFKVEVTGDLMLLTYERCCMLQCQKICSNGPKDGTAFSLLGALEGSYFSDLTITAASGKQFKVHKVILQLAAPEADWTGPPVPPLSGLSEDVTYTILHYLYAECLPQGLSEDTAKECLKSVAKLPGFTSFQELCGTFLKNTALKQQICSLVEDMHACANHVIDMFSGKTGLSGDGQLPAVGEENLMLNPAKLCYVVKQAFRESTVAGAKLLILCDLFSRRKAELSREERHEIIKYAKSRLPVFMGQLRQLLEVCKHHCSSLSAAQRLEIASYLVPEIETALDMISTFVVELRTALEHVISLSSQEKEKHEKHKKGHIGEVLGKTLKLALHMKELRKLKTFHEKIEQSFHNLMQKKDNFTVLSQEDKVRSVAKNMEQLIDEVPLFLVRIEELMTALDEKVSWAEWKYLFKLGTSKVAWVLSKMQAHKSTLQALIDRGCTMVHRDQFTHSLAAVGLAPSPPPAGSGDVQSAASSASSATSAAKPRVPQSTRYAQLNSVESLCQSPYPEDSCMARKLLELLQAERQTDMIFEIITVQESGDVVIDHTHGDPVTRTDHQKEVDIHKVPAHRVVIAARCDWFRRALLSGMRESIDRRITVHDTNPILFKLFLKYLYSGQLDTSLLTIDQLADMMTLGDRYEMDSLKSLCEKSLEHHLSEDTVLFLLSLADQFTASTLRKCTLNYISEHLEVLQSEIFEELPEHLQAEVEDAAWRLRPGAGTAGGAHGFGLHSHTETPSSLSSNSEMDELVGALELNDGHLYRGDRSSSGSSEELHFVEDSARVEQCVSQLLEIIGGDVPREELVRIALAADYDVNRALNFFFSS